MSPARRVGAAPDAVRAPRPLPIGVFDSGIGGLTVLRALLAALPSERFIYLGDTARLPYGTKTSATVERYSVQAAQTLVARGIRCLVVACNTASSVALPAIRGRLRPLPVVGVIDPGADAACAATRSGRIAVLATERTVSGGAYERAILERRPGSTVVAVPAPLFVALAEEGLVEGPIVEGIARHYLAPLFGGPQAAGAPDASIRDIGAPDTIVLGCTHFPVLAGAIRAVVGSHIAIVDSAETTARAVREALQAGGGGRIGGTEVSAETRNAGAGAQMQFLATDGVERFARVGGRFLGRVIRAKEVELVDL
ncbi:MAG: glutamate racemase [Steroidobacteraceae bacterium]